MTTINLRDYYPFCNSDLFIEVSDEVAATLAEDKRREQNYLRRVAYLPPNGEEVHRHPRADPGNPQ